MMGIKEIIGEKRNEILKIASRHGAKDVRVFGSVARGDARPDSDVDFLVKLEPGVTLLGHAALVRELENYLGRKVDVISEMGLRQRVRHNVLREARPL
jgi:predicted nucleotidyltransferase